MKRNKPIILFQKVLLFLAVICIVLAILITAARIITPRLDLQKDKLEALASMLLTQPVQIKSIKVSWDQLSPIIQCKEVKVLNDAKTTILIDIDHLGLRINLIHSLFKRKIIIDKLLISGANLTIQQSLDNHFSIVGVQNLEKQLQSSDKKPGHLTEIIDWLFAQQDVIINNCHLLIKRNASKSISISDLTLHLHNNGAKHRLTGQVTILQKKPASLLIDANMTGNPSDADRFKASVYLRVNKVFLKEWLTEVDLSHYKIDSGLLNADIWAEWKHHHWKKIQSQFNIDHLRIGTDKQQLLEIETISTNLNLIALSSKQWLLNLDKLRITAQNQHWTTNHLGISVTNPFLKDQIINQLQLDYLNDHMLKTFKPLLPKILQTRLEQLKPRGTLTNIVYLKNDKTNDFNIFANLEKVSFSSWKKFPAIKHLSAKLQLTKKVGHLFLKSENTIIDFADLFRNPINLTSLDGHISWFKKNNNWLIKFEKLSAINSDLQVNSDAVLLLPTNNNGIRINLLAGFKFYKVRNKAHYLPSGILTKKLVTWLDKAIIDGKSGSGALILRGNLEDFPFSNNKGKFLALSKMEDITLNYKEHWPIIKHLNAQLKFDADKMFITANSGNIYSSRINSVTATIPKLSADESTLNIKGQITGELAEAAHFIQDSPLAKTLGKLKAVSLNGPMRMALQLQIPLDTDESIKILGTTKFSWALLKLAKPNITLPLGKGKIHFTEDTLSSSLLSGTLFEKPISMQINKGKHEDQTIITINGNLDISEYFKQKPYNQWFTGNTFYQAKLFLTKNTKSSDHLTISSNLTGITIKLPPPFNKSAVQKIHFSSNLQLTTNNQFPFEFNYGEQLSGKLLIQEHAFEKWDINKGKISIGINNYNPKLIESGLIVNGHLKKIDWQDWQPFIQQLKISQLTEKNITNIELNKINLQIDKLIFNDYKFNRITLEFQPSNHHWRVNIINDLLKGSFQIAKKPYQPWDVNLDYLHLPNKNEHEPFKNIDLADIPSINFNCNETVYGEKKLGKLNFSLLSLTPHRKKIIDLKMISGNINLYASGIWKQIKNNHSTTINGHIIGTNISQALKELDFPAVITSREAQLKFRFNYPSMPYDLSLKTLQGSLSVSFKNGQLLDVGDGNATQLGFGRLLTFLSVKNITRRLKLDFSDLTQQGFVFDRLKGNFQINDGNAYIKNFTIVSPIARINITGKIGLANKDYDLDLAIIPNLTSSLPIIATIAGGPIAGVVTWAADRILNAQVKKTIHYSYKMNGTWNKPIIKPITAVQETN